MQKVKVKINLQAIRHNAEAFSKLTGAKLCAVVKADAYGHGAEEVVNALEGVADFFAVALLEEAISIRTAVCGKKILVFTPPTDKEEGYLLAANGFISAVSDMRTAKLLVEVSKQYRLPIEVHLKINTGMNRYGADFEALEALCRFLKSQKQVKVTGVYSHLCECSLNRAKKQRALFEQAKNLCKCFFPDAIVHLSATYGAMLGKDFIYDAVRVGIGLYGYWPCEPSDFSGVKRETVEKLSLQKAMTVWAKVTAVRAYAFGGAGYGKELPLEKNESLSVLRVGYADGFLRRKENGTAGEEKNLSPLCMDVCIRADEGKIGEWLPVLTDADETAKVTGTISYEVLCAATRRAEFIYEHEKK